MKKNNSIADDVHHDPAYQEMMKLFEELTFFQRMRKMFVGLGKPKSSGEYKFARLQALRLSAIFCAKSKKPEPLKLANRGWP